MSELQADPNSLFQKIFVSQTNAWQIGLAASMCLFKATLSRGLRTGQSWGNQLYWDSSRAKDKQALGTELDMHGWPFCAASTTNFFLQGKPITIPYREGQTKPTTQNSDKINLTFKISCSCLKTAWTSSCKSHLNSSSCVVGIQQWNHQTSNTGSKSLRHMWKLFQF